MRPKDESKKEKVESKKEEDTELDVSKELTGLTDEENLILKLLKENSPAELNQFKDQTGLSNKKWDTAIKGLRKHELVKV
ncbi:hypothetical protein ACFLRQ_00470 [Bacteroidota bacterium]